MEFAKHHSAVFRPRDASSAKWCAQDRLGARKRFQDLEARSASREERDRHEMGDADIGHDILNRSGDDDTRPSSGPVRRITTDDEEAGVAMTSGHNRPSLTD